MSDKELAIRFSLFCAENYMHTSGKDDWRDSSGNKYTTEDLFEIFLKNEQKT